MDSDQTPKRLWWKPCQLVNRYSPNTEDGDRKRSVGGSGEGRGRRRISVAEQPCLRPIYFVQTDAHLITSFSIPHSGITHPCTSNILSSISADNLVRPAERRVPKRGGRGGGEARERRREPRTPRGGAGSERSKGRAGLTETATSSRGGGARRQCAATSPGPNARGVPSRRGRTLAGRPRGSAASSGAGRPAKGSRGGGSATA